MDCLSVLLNVDALAHLSRVPTFNQLSVMLKTTLPDQIALSDFPLLFSSLRYLTLHSDSINPIPRFLSRTRLPAPTNFSSMINNLPSKLDLASLSASFQTSGIVHNIQYLILDQNLVLGLMHVARVPMPILVFEDPLDGEEYETEIAEWHPWLQVVNRSDSELLTLALAWPHLESLPINERWSWNSQGGITPNGLLQLLQICPSLDRIALAHGHANI